MKFLLGLANIALAIGLAAYAKTEGFVAEFLPLAVVVFLLCHGVVILGAERKGTFGRLWRLWGLWIDTKEAELRKRMASAPPEVTGGQEA